MKDGEMGRLSWVIQVRLMQSRGSLQERPGRSQRTGGVALGVEGQGQRFKDALPLALKRKKVRPRPRGVAGLGKLDKAKRGSLPWSLPYSLQEEPVSPAP